MRRPILRKVVGIGLLLSAGAAAGVLLGLVPNPVHAFGKQNPAKLVDQAIEISATPIQHFEAAHPERTQFGRLQWRGGLALSSSSEHFGGWSGIAIDPAGERLLAVSDAGTWMTARLAYEGTRPTALVDARIGALRGVDGRPLPRRQDRDAEGVALLAGTLTGGEALVSFEQNHRLLRFPVTAQGVGPATGAIPLPPVPPKLRFNKGLEAVCRLHDGGVANSLVVFAERMTKNDGSQTGWLRPQSATGAAAWRMLSPTTIDGYDLTDCAGLPNGGLLLLERRFRVAYGDPVTGGKMRLRRFSAAEIASNQVMTGEILLEAGRAHAIDNMEGVAVHTDPQGRVIVTLISDDNFNAVLQRTVLLQFMLVD